MKTLAKLTLFVFILTSCKKDFGENKNLLVETFTIPKYSENNVIFEHEGSICVMGYPEDYDTYSGLSEYYSIYSFDLNKGRFKTLEKNVEIDYEYSDYSDDAKKLISATSCQGDVYILNSERALIKLKSDFSYGEEDEITRYPDALGLFSFNNMVFVTLSNNKLAIYDPATKFPMEVEIKGNPVRQIAKKDNYFYVASGKNIYKSLDCKSWEIQFNVFPESNKELLSINYHNGTFVCVTRSDLNVYTVKINSVTGQVLTFTNPFDYSQASNLGYSSLDDGCSGYGYFVEDHYFGFIDEFKDGSYNSEYKRSLFPQVSQDLSNEKTKVADGYVFNDINREDNNKKNSLKIIQLENYLIYLDNTRLKKVTIPTN